MKHSRTTAREQRLLLLGCGNMGRAFLEGWRKSGLLKTWQVTVVDPTAEIPDAFGITLLRSVQALPKGEPQDVLFIAVKPQHFHEAVSACKTVISGETLAMSIAAGISLDGIRRALFSRQPAVRIMPNLPVTVGKGVSVCYADRTADKTHREITAGLLESVGSAHWVEDESLMDAVTALAGSGPAFVFYFLEALQQAAGELGLPEPLADQLAREMLIGAAAMLEQTKERPAALRERVTSKQGTTEAGLNVFMADSQLKDLIKRTLVAAQRRSKELNG